MVIEVRLPLCNHFIQLFQYFINSIFICDALRNIVLIEIFINHGVWVLFFSRLIFFDVI